MVSDGCIMLLPESLSPGEQLEGLRGLNMVDISQLLGVTGHIRGSLLDKIIKFATRGPALPEGNNESPYQGFSIFA